MNNKTVIVTGANTGIGKATAIGIAKAGARVIMACRNLERANAARDDVIRESGNDNVVVRILDLASLDSVRKFADTINAEEERVDVLMNNAGIYAASRKMTEDGFEMVFQVNHLGPFLLNNLLLNKLKTSAPSRIVIVSSNAHRFRGKVDFSNIELERGWSVIRAYAQSKTMNILTAMELAKILKGTGVCVYALCPGTVETEIQRDISIFQNKCFRCCIYPLCARCVGYKLVQPQEGALTPLYCAMEPSIQGESGHFYRECAISEAKPYAVDPEAAQKLWELSSTLCGIDTQQDT